MINPEDFLEFIKNRRTIRSFQDMLIPNNKIQMILEAGRWTPSASNKQPWEFYVIKDKETLKEISKNAFYGRHIKRAPLAIAIVGKKKISPNYYIQDTSLVSMTMMLMAWSLGIGTCWIGALDRKKVKEILGLGEDDFLLTVLPMGYIKGDIPKPTLRTALDQIIKEI
ncbi:MAG: nitroreductase family protein [Candidatus Lokiarchaeota archaeon]|nr:nitroreductase family protein [Candidatus Lokiarchaeota archaeon]